MPVNLTVASHLIDASIVLEKSKIDTNGPAKGPRVDHNPEAAGRARESRSQSLAHLDLVCGLMQTLQETTDHSIQASKDIHNQMTALVFYLLVPLVLYLQIFH